jgi:uncharacterized phiE125 gp8 family phage protein
VDSNGTTQTWAASNYTVDAPAGPECTPGRVIANYGVTYPSTQSIPNAVTVRFVAGYGAAASAVPYGIKAAMKLLIGHWWVNRQAVNLTGPGNTESTVPLGVDSLLWPFKVWTP